MEAAQKLARTDNPQTSKDAAEKMVKSGALNRQEQEILNTIDSMPGSAMKSFDFTTKDVAARLQIRYPYDKAYDICRKRFSDLQMKGKIELVLYKYPKIPPINKRRDGCRVWRLK